MQYICVILPSVACLSLQYFSKLSHKEQNFINENSLSTKCVLIFSTNLSESFLILRRTERDMVKKVYWSSCKVPVCSCPSLMKLEFSGQIFERKLISNTYITFHENSSSGSRVSPCGQTDRHDEANSRFSPFCKRS
jgi:hypothetical protein